MSDPCVMAATTFPLSAVERHTKRLRELFKWGGARANERKPQHDDYVIQLRKDVLSRDRSKAIEHVVSLVVDIAQRGSIDDAEAIGQALIAIARSEHAAANREERRVMLSRAEALLAEEAAEAAVEQAETSLALFPTLGNHLKYLALSAEHSRARRNLDDVVQRDIANGVTA